MKVVDRIVSALLSFAVIPVAFFVPIIHWFYQITGYGLLNSILGGKLTEVGDQGWTEDNYSLYGLYDLLKSFGVDFEEMLSKGSANEALAPITPYVKWVVAFFALTLVIALVSGIVSIFTNKKIVTFACGGLGIASLIGMMISFNKMVAPILSGQVTLGAIFDVPMLGAIAKIETINLSSAWVVMLVLFIVLIFWSASYLLTKGEEEKKKEHEEKMMKLTKKQGKKK